LCTLQNTNVCITVVVIIIITNAKAVNAKAKVVAMEGQGIPALPTDAELLLLHLKKKNTARLKT